MFENHLKSLIIIFKPKWQKNLCLFLTWKLFWNYVNFIIETFFSDFQAMWLICCYKVVGINLWRVKINVVRLVADEFLYPTFFSIVAKTDLVRTSSSTMEKMRHFSDFFTLKEKDNTKHDQVLATEIQIKSENNVPRKKEGVITNYLLRYHSCSFAC